MTQFRGIRITKFPVIVSYTFIWKSKPLDASNCTYMVKLLEDGLVKSKVIPNDDVSIVSEIQIRSSQDKSIPADLVVISIASDPSK